MSQRSEKKRSDISLASKCFCQSKAVFPPVRLLALLIGCKDVLSFMMNQSDYRTSVFCVLKAMAHL